jgi:FixJ family two-component response regulator
MSEPIARNSAATSPANNTLSSSQKAAGGQRQARSSPRAPLALLVGKQDELFQALGFTLASVGIKTIHAEDYSEISTLLSAISLPDIIFANTHLPGGAWKEVRSLISTSSRSVPMVLVSPVVDIRLYLNALEGGAVDFIVPPFRPSDLAFIVSSAIRSSSSPAAGQNRPVGAAELNPQVLCQSPRFNGNGS